MINFKGVWSLHVNIPYEAAIKSVLEKKTKHFEKFTKKHCVRVSVFIKNSLCHNFIKIETLAQVFHCEFCKIFKNTFFTEHLRATTSSASALPIPMFIENGKVFKQGWSKICMLKNCDWEEKNIHSIGGHGYSFLYSW